MSAPTAKELLERAAEYVAKHGLAKGDLGDKGGPCCMLGALWAGRIWVTLGALLLVLAGCSSAAYSPLVRAPSEPS